jgi:hypothetical protein
MGTVNSLGWSLKLCLGDNLGLKSLVDD